MNNRIVINGKEFQCNLGNVVISNGKVIINGKVIESDINNINEVNVYGNVSQLKCDSPVNINGSVEGDVDCGGSCNIGGNVNGDVDAGGSVNCRDVKGNVDAGGSIICANMFKTEV